MIQIKNGSHIRYTGRGKGIFIAEKIGKTGVVFDDHKGYPGIHWDDKSRDSFHHLDNMELIKPIIEVGKTYKRIPSGYDHLIIFMNDDVVFTSCIQTSTYYSFKRNKYPDTGWIEVIRDRYVAVTYKTCLKDSVETGSKFYVSEAEVRAEYGNRPLFAGVVKLENA